MDIPAIIIYAMCLFEAVWCLRKIFYYAKIRKTGIKCQAQITGSKQYQSRNGIRYSPVLKYVDTDGRAHSVTAAYGRSEAKIVSMVGREVTVYYDRDDPEKMIFEKKELLFPIFCLVTVMLFPVWVYFKFR